MNMKTKEELAQVRIYKKEHGILTRLAFRKRLAKKPYTIADIIRDLIKGS
jgi:hypothetical protein